MTRVLCTPHAGVLSALGIGLAGVTKLAERSLAPADEPAVAFASLENSLRVQLTAEGIPAERLAPPRRTLEMRYQGQETRLPIAEPADGDFLSAFAREHHRLFNFSFHDRAVENYAARVELSTVLDTFPVAETASLPCQPEPAFVAQTWFEQAHRATRVFERRSLTPGTLIPGPAIVLESVATVVVEPGWTAEVTLHDDLLLTSGNPASSEPPEPSELSKPNCSDLSPDIVELELYHGRFTSIAEQMGAALQRTALSTNVKERLDFSCALFDGAGALVANAAHIPVHLGAMQACVRCLIADVPDLRPGEVYVTNDPFRGGSHLPDVTVITPVFVDGAVRFFTASRAHHAEIGGITPGSLPPGATNLAEEGVLLRAFRYDTSHPAAGDIALRDLLLAGPYPTRSVEENLADLHAQFAANQTGVIPC